MIAFSRPDALPLPGALFVTEASPHDLEALRPLAEDIQEGEFWGDKAYVDGPLFQQMKQQGLQLVTPLNEPRPIPLSLYFNGPIMPWSQR